MGSARWRKSCTVMARGGLGLLMGLLCILRDSPAAGWHYYCASMCRPVISIIAQLDLSFEVPMASIAQDAEL